ncbi:MAG: hypothetical protein LH472_04110 [Pyrinomonadaceae bacterium]|nr:hypothetical protein [Pyrinomonadaceae bacterium]
MKERSESILFVIVGLIAGIGGAYGLLYSNYQEISVWLMMWNDIRLIVGIALVVAGIRGILKK